MKGSIARAQELVAQTPGAWMPQQFDNPANVVVHARTTAEEIARDFPDGIDALITGVGSGGHLTGCAQVLKQRWPRIKVFAVEAEAAREGAPLRPRRRHAGGHLQRSDAGSDCTEAPAAAGRRARSRVQLRHRRALPLDRGLPAHLSPQANTGGRTQRAWDRRFSAAPTGRC